MRIIILILTILMTGPVSCYLKEEEPDIPNYIEQRVSFFDPSENNYANGKYQGYIYETWIRQPDYLKMVHETFKKIGYKKLFSHYNNHAWSGFLLDAKKPHNELIDSLLKTHNLDTIHAKYYREFWNRRKTKKNDSIVFAILREVSMIVYHDSLILANTAYVNDTLFRLIKIKEFEDSLTNKKALQNFNYLRSIGFHESAYNLLFERYEYFDISWNRIELKKTLQTDTINYYRQAFIEDNTK